jgi:tetratricopeptide (TPR) repeat protein
MTSRRRQLLILGVSVVAFAGMVVLVATGISSRRRNRDLMFGLEQLDILIADHRLDEAAAMIPWLVARADEATEILSVLKRGVAVLDAGGGAESLDDAAQVAIGVFPGNSAVRSVAVYAAVMTGDLDRALEWSRVYLADANPLLFAWVLLKSGLAPPDPEEDAPDQSLAEPFFLAGLGSDQQPADFEQAWRLTGDWRYAADAAILHLESGGVAAALDVIVGASVPVRAPLLAADIFRDAGDDASALGALRNASAESESRVLPRMADALMSTNQFEAARSIYRDMAERMPEDSPVPLVNLAWMDESPEAASAFYDAAVAGFPGSWQAIEQRALHLAVSDLDAAYASLADYTGPDGGTRQSLLKLKLEPLMDQRGYEAAVWTLAAVPGVPDDALRFAAWYFTGRGQRDALLELLGSISIQASWLYIYTGVAHAWTGAWPDAVEAFAAAYSANPSWMTALNLAVSLLAVGETEDGMEALANAESLARRSGLPTESSQVFVTLARATTDRVVAYDAITTALELNPTNTEALLIRVRLESGSGY